MSIHRQKARRDENEEEIVDGNLAVGNSVERLSGEGVTDLVIGVEQFPHVCPHCGKTFYQSENLLQEVKMPGGKLTPPQVKFHTRWVGPISVVRSLEESLRNAGRID